MLFKRVFFHKMFSRQTRRKKKCSQSNTTIPNSINIFVNWERIKMVIWCGRVIRISLTSPSDGENRNTRTTISIRDECFISHKTARIFLQCFWWMLEPRERWARRWMWSWSSHWVAIPSHQINMLTCMLSILFFFSSFFIPQMICLVTDSIELPIATEHTDRERERERSYSFETYIIIMHIERIDVCVSPCLRLLNSFNKSEQ